MSLRRPGVGFILELSLGHTTHAKNLQASIAGDPRVVARFRPIPFEVSGASARIPGYGNWTIRAGVRARRAIRQLKGTGQLDALFIHTQVPAILSPDHLRRTPTVVSLDATPIQYDELGAFYQHEMGPQLVERLKWRAHHACFTRAARIVTWSAWTKAGLVERYDVDPDKVLVIPPGVDLMQWDVPPSVDRRARTAADPLRVLFVGGDLDRKGGSDLLHACRRLRQEGHSIELDLVTHQTVPPEPGVAMHHGLTPNSAELVRLYHDSDVFCLPTNGDCLPVVLIEAGAAGLPLVSTDVGAIREIVRDGETGFLVPTRHPEQLARALESMAADRDLRWRLGEQARAHVNSRYNASLNARRIVDVLIDVADEPSRRARDQPRLIS